MARWRTRHFTVVAALGPQWVELGHSKAVVSWLLQYHVVFRGAPDLARPLGRLTPNPAPQVRRAHPIAVPLRRCGAFVFFSRVAPYGPPTHVFRSFFLFLLSLSLVVFFLLEVVWGLSPLLGVAFHERFSGASLAFLEFMFGRCFWCCLVCFMVCFCSPDFFA